jgi:hypothetical protein
MGPEETVEVAEREIQYDYKESVASVEGTSREAIAGDNVTEEQP